jgi:hypothetical protein
MDKAGKSLKKSSTVKFYKKFDLFQNLFGSDKHKISGCVLSPNYLTIKKQNYD